MYMHPGVYVEHVPSGILAVEAASTSVTAFVGAVRRGPIGQPVFITSADQYQRLFGDLDGRAGGIRDHDANQGEAPDYFGHAVQAYFLNGGTKAYITRVGERVNMGRAVIAIPSPEDPAIQFTVTATSEGVWGDAIFLRLSPTDAASTPDLGLGYTFEIGIIVDGEFIALETFTGLDIGAEGSRPIENIVNDESALVDIASAPLALPSDVQSDSIVGGAVVVDPVSGLVEVGGAAVDITIGATSATVVFAAPTADVGVLAAQIQTQVRAQIASAPDFTATVETNELGERIIVLRSYLLGPAGNLSTAEPVDVALTSALAELGLDTTDSASTVPYPPTSLSAGGIIGAALAGGADGPRRPPLAEFQTVFTTLRDYRDISIILLPGLHWIEAGDNSIIQAAVAHAEFMQNRMVIVDPPDPAPGNGANALVTPKDVNDLGVSTSPYVALYYPWLNVSNPYYDPDTAANKPKTLAIPPSAFAAGMWARIDGKRGVWKAPAGLETTVRGVIGPNLLIGNMLQDNLNDSGVNCLRSIIGPTVIWGARTRATKTKPEDRYVPVRRTQSMIGESLYNALQAVVFEPNDHRLWAALRASAGGFMDTLHRAGAFQGEKASDAYYVQCGLGTTMTQADIDLGVVILVVGFSPLKPAEFVVVRIKQIVGQTA